MPFSSRDLAPNTAVPLSPIPDPVAEQFKGSGFGSEFLLTVFSDGSREIAWRGDQWSTWSPPVKLTAVPLHAPVDEQRRY